MCLAKTLTLSVLLHLTSGYSFDQTNLTDQGKVGAVASESAICSRAGTAMLEKGGNAVDAVCFTRDSRQILQPRVGTGKD